MDSYNEYNGPPVKTTHEKIIVNQIIPYQPILSPEPPCYRSAQRNCPAEQGCLDWTGLAGTMGRARCLELFRPTPHPRRLLSTSQNQTVKVSGRRSKAASINGFRGLISQRLMGPDGVVLLNVCGNCLVQGPGRGVFIEVDFLCFEAAEHRSIITLSAHRDFPSMLCRM